MGVLSGTTDRTTVQPAPSPVNLDQRLDIPRAILSITGIIVGAIFFAVGAALWGAGVREPAEWRSTGQWIAFVAGVGLVFAGIGIFVLSFWYLASIVRYEMRSRWIWTEQHLYERQQQGGVIVEEERTEWSLRIDNAYDVLAVALWVYIQVQNGRRTPWSVDSLSKNPLYLGGENKLRLLGNISEHQARKFGSEFVRLGLVRGRTEKSAGQWVATSADDVLEAVMKGLR